MRSIPPPPPPSEFAALRQEQAQIEGISTNSKMKPNNKKLSAHISSSSSSSQSSDSLSSGSGSSVGNSKQDEVIDRMKSNLSRFARVSNKRMAVRTLQDCAYLRSIPMEPSAPLLPSVQSKEWQLIEDEVGCSNIQLNGLLFTTAPNRKNHQLLKVLKALCTELCKGLRQSPDSVYRGVIVRLASSSNSADSYFQLNALLGGQDLILQPRDKSAPPPIGQPPLPPTDVSLYEAGGQIHAVITTYTPYGLFRRTDVKNKKAWISLWGQVLERVNLSTNSSVRQVKAKLTTPE